MENLLLDTNFIYSLFSLKDSNHKRAVRIAEQFSGSENFIIPVVVAAELTCSGHAIDLAETAKVFTNKLVPHVEVDIKFIKQIPPDKCRSFKSVDYLILAMCKRLEAKLVTFDRTLGNTYKTLV